MTKPRVLSGVQPTGNLHLGNYLGAIRNWVGLQDSHECLFMLADLHAITVPQNPADLTRNTRETAAAYIACGIDPKRSAIFPQSAVTMHAELAWILNCHTPLGWLNRMTQFKEKSGKNKEAAPVGLYAYPVLMAADILGYHATHVPVGEDQKQHLELARDIAGAFNRAYGEEFFPLPEPLIMPTAARIMSLRDGSKKMSKSDPSDYSRITLTDDADAIAKKIRKATSDSIEGVTYDPEGRPEVANLLTIYGALTNSTWVEMPSTPNSRRMPTPSSVNGSIISEINKCIIDQSLAQ
jgi:tryptophanyl-tRNA synthetase